MDMQRKFVKLDKGRYAFVTKGPDFVRTEEFDLKKAKELYIESMNERKTFGENLGKCNRELKNLDVKPDAELEHFIELANRAAKYTKMQELLGQQKYLLDEIEKMGKQCEAIEKLIPEVKRIAKS